MIIIVKIIYRCLLTLNATILLAFIYIIKGKVYLGKIGECSIIIYIIGILLFTYICLKGMEILPDDSLEGIQDISLANDTYMSSYLGYFFVALSISDGEWMTFWIVFLVVNVFTFFSQSLYYNPLFLLFGFNFYYITSCNQTRIFIISRKKDIRKADEVSFNYLKRVNEFTFIDKER